MDLWAFTELGYFTRITAVPNYYKLFEGAYSPSIRPTLTEPWGSLTGSLTSQQDLVDYITGQISGKANASDLTAVVNTVNANGTAITACLVKTANLADLANVVTARTNLDVYSKEEVQTAITTAENVQPTATGPSGQLWQGGPSPHAFWRLAITSTNTNSGVSISELEFRQQVGVAQQATGGAPFGSAEYAFGSDPGKAFDGDLLTDYSSAAVPTVGAPVYIGYQFPTARAINEIAITNTHDSRFPGQLSPNNFSIQWSDDGSQWTTEWTIANLVWNGTNSQQIVLTHPRAGQTATAYQNYPTKLVALNDVNITEGAGIDGYVLTWSNADQKWEAKQSAFSSSIAASTILGNNTAGAAAPTALTAVQVVAMLPVFTNTAKGLVPASGGGATAFLRADGGFYVPTLGGLSEVDLSTPATDGQALLYNNASGKWKAAALPSGVVTLAALNDVALGTLADGKVLTYQASSSKWIAQAPVAGSSTLASLTDVAVGSQSNNQILSWNSLTGKWTAVSVPVVGTTTGPSGPIVAGGPPAARYWRVRCSATNGGSNFDIAGLQFREVPGTAQFNTGGTPIAIDSAGGYSPANAFDNNNSTEWASSGGPTGGYTPWIGYDFGNGVTKVIKEIAITSELSNSWWPIQSPKNFVIEFSFDGANWTTQYTLTNVGWTSGGQIQVFTDPNANVSSVTTHNYPETLAALNDINVTTAPTDGQTLIYNAATGKWLPKTCGTIKTVFTASGSFTPNARTKLIHIQAWGGGGSGSSGAFQTSLTTAALPGAGGGGGAFAEADFDPALIPAGTSIVIGAGGAAVAANATAGVNNNGNSGGVTQVGTGGSILSVNGGGGATGTTGGSSGTPAATGGGTGGGGVAGSASGSAPAATTNPWAGGGGGGNGSNAIAGASGGRAMRGGSGGGSGGACTTTNAPTAGGSGGNSYIQVHTAPAGGANTGAVGSTKAAATDGSAGDGGGGGGANTAGAGGAGGVGQQPGGGGGGGGGAQGASVLGGAGGKGGDGLVIITEFLG